MPPNPCPAPLGHRLGRHRGTRKLCHTRGRCPQPCRGLRLAVPACKATRDSPWEWEWTSTPTFGCSSRASPSSWCWAGLSRAGSAVAPGRCAQPWRVPAAAGWHQMKTNGLGDTSASINGSAVSGMLGTCQHRQQEQQRWVQHPTREPRGSAGSALGFHTPSSALPGAHPELLAREGAGWDPARPPHIPIALSPSPLQPQLLPSHLPLTGHFWACTHEPPMPVPTHLSGGSGISQVALPALEGIPSPRGARAAVVREGDQEQPRDEAGAPTLPTFSTP